MGVAGANMQWGHFVCPSSSQKRESTAFRFDLILRSAWGLSSLGKQVGKSSTSTPCRKWSQVWGRESEWWPKYMQCNRVASVGNGKNFEKQAQSSRGNVAIMEHLSLKCNIFACRCSYHTQFDLKNISTPYYVFTKY